MDAKDKEIPKARKVGVYDRPDGKSGGMPGNRLMVAIPIIIVLLLILYYLFGR